MPAVARPLQTADRIRELVGENPVDLSALLEAGLTRGQVRAACNAGYLVRLRHGVYQVRLVDGLGAAVDALESLRESHLRAAAAALLQMADSAAASHGSAGLFHGLPTMRPGPPVLDDVDITTERHGRRIRGTHLRIGRLDPADVVEIDGVRTTSLARTVLDLSRFRPLRESLVVMDECVRRIGVAPLWAALDRMPIVYGRVGLREAISAADARSESPLESASRGVMIAAGLPVPELQAVITVGTETFRADFLWRKQRVVGESDGWGKYGGVRDLRAEKRREDALRRAGYTVVRWTSDELWRTPEVVVARILAALARP